MVIVGLFFRVFFTRINPNIMCGTQHINQLEVNEEEIHVRAINHKGLRLQINL